MTAPAAPELTVRYEGSAHTFPAGADVVVGRDIHADVRVPDPLISRAHLVLRFDTDRWVAVDNDSLNGMFVGGRRVPEVDLQDGQHINIGSLVGPRLTFQVGHPDSAAAPAADRAPHRSAHIPPPWAPPRAGPPTSHPTSQPASARSAGRDSPPSLHRDRPASAAPPTTTS